MGVAGRGGPFVLATANPGKAREISEILGDDVELLPRPAEVPDVEETGDTLVDNARLKAWALVDATGMAAIADDTGLEVDALDGAPGVRSARYAGEAADPVANVAKLLDALAGYPTAEERRARFRTVIVVAWPDGSELVSEGSVDGWIAPDPRGEGGFGYDPVFVPVEGDGSTFAEMAPASKHAISHRGRALRQLSADLEPRG
jgi:XTP/dITP diphosphohydrolase